MYYVFDPTRPNDQGQTLVAQHDTSEKVVAHLELICPKLLSKTRQEFMSDAADLGYGDDDRRGKNFTSLMQEYVNFGIIRKDGQPIRCDIFTSEDFSKTEYGD